MDGTKFDAITQRLAAAATRRRIVSGVLAGAAMLTGAALAGLDDAEAKKGKGKAKGKGKGKNKVAICHKIDEDTFEFMKVPAPALKRGHRKHGDTICGETEPGTCQTSEATGCNEDGTCIFTAAVDGEPCITEEIPDGICQGGVCVDNPAT